MNSIRYYLTIAVLAHPAFCYGAQVKKEIQWPVRLKQEVEKNPQFGAALLAAVKTSTHKRTPSLDEAVRKLEGEYQAVGIQVSKDPFEQANRQFQASDYEQAAVSFERCFQGGLDRDADPVHVRNAHVNYGETLLALGAYPKGWHEREWRLRHGHTPLTKPWKGQSPKGKRFLIRREGDIGDTAFFTLRYLPILKAAGAAKIICEGSFPEQEMLWQASSVNSVVKPGACQEPFDCDIYSMSLPLYLSSEGETQTTLSSIPSDPYIQGNKELVEKWSKMLHSKPGLHLGINWRASKQPAGVTRVLKRDIPLAELAQLSKIKGVTLYNLQGPEHRPISQEEYDKLKSAGALKELDEWDILPKDCAVTALEDFDKVPFTDVIAFAQALKETKAGGVISVDTSVPCVTGGVGARTIMLLPKEADWRWGTNEEVSRWNPSAFLLRQTTQDDWKPVMNTLRQQIERIVQSQSPAEKS